MVHRTLYVTNFPINLNLNLNLFYGRREYSITIFQLSSLISTAFIPVQLLGSSSTFYMGNELEKNGNYLIDANSYCSSPLVASSSPSLIFVRRRCFLSLHYYTTSASSRTTPYFILHPGLCLNKIMAKTIHHLWNYIPLMLTCLLVARQGIAYLEQHAYLFHRYWALRTDITVNKSRTTFINSEISSFALLMGRTTFFHQWNFIIRVVIGRTTFFH